jgi:hypothetical protein
MNDREAAVSEVQPIRDAILHALNQVPTAAGLSGEAEPGGTMEPETILAKCVDGTEIAIEISVL